jgi:hypothetical protein
MCVCVCADYHGQSAADSQSSQRSEHSKKIRLDTSARAQLNITLLRRMTSSFSSLEDLVDMRMNGIDVRAYYKENLYSMSGTALL